MSIPAWVKYKDRQPVNLEDVVEKGGRYFFNTPGQKSGVVTVGYMEDDTAFFVYDKDTTKAEYPIYSGFMFFHIKPEDSLPKKVGGKKSRRNKKSRKNRRKTNRRY
jgi:hypothetical protein